MDIPRKPDLTYLAKTHYRDVEKTFGIKRADRRQHMYILGKSGTGKSALLTNMIVQNIANGEGLAVVDPHGELIEDILKLIPKERMDDVVYFNPADNEFHTGFNMLEVPDPKYKHLIASGLMGIFTKIWANVWSSRMEYILNNTILALIETPGTTMLSIPRMLVDTDYRNFIVGNVTDPVVKSFWTNEFEAWNEKFRNEAIAPIQNKVGQFLSTSLVRNIVGQEKSTIDIYEIMNTKKILLVNVSKGRIGEDNSALLGAMMITKIQLAAMERVRIPESERKDFYLYVDEFQNFVTESFASILSEARKYRLCLTVAHQYIGQLSTADSVVVRDAVFGNVGSMIIFRIGATDAEFIEKEFEPEFTAQDFVNLPNYHIYLKLMIDGVTSRPFSAKTLPPFRSEGSREIEYQIIERAQNLYARPRADVERDISAWSNKKIRPSFDNVPSDPDEVIESPDGKFRIKCSLFDECGNIAEVPFKPEKGRPVYCKEHIQKMKDAEGETPKEIPLISTPKNKEGDRPRIKIKEPVHLSSPKTSPAPASQKPLPKKQQTSIVTPSSKSNQEEPAPFVPKNNFKKEETPSSQASEQTASVSMRLADLVRQTQKSKPIPPKEASTETKDALRAAIEAAQKAKEVQHKESHTEAPRVSTSPKKDIASQQSAPETTPQPVTITESRPAEPAPIVTTTFIPTHEGSHYEILKRELEEIKKERDELKAKLESLIQELKHVHTHPAPVAHTHSPREQEVFTETPITTQSQTPPKYTPSTSSAYEPITDTREIPEAPYAGRTPKEVPEDILRNILE